ncbi:MAG: hypothetical protein JKY80_00445, partial [Mariprofundaceae bacterium]|nr:hypothetical protein [Mariprofundaceae bacterium]
NSWDKFYIPKPFTRGVLVMGEEIVIAKDDDLDAAIARTQQGMDAAQQLADHYFD